MFGFRLVKWVPIDRYISRTPLSEEVIMKFADGVKAAGWKDDDGWHFSNCADHMDYPCDPQPTHVAHFPET